MPQYPKWLVIFISNPTKTLKARNDAREQQILMRKQIVEREAATHLTDYGRISAIKHDWRQDTLFAAGMISLAVLFLLGGGL